MNTLQRIALWEGNTTTMWRSGFANMLRKENHAWWRTRRWWMQLGLWTLVIDGLLALILFGLVKVQTDATQNVEQFDLVTMGLQAVFQLGTTFVAAGVIILGQGLLLGERESGVAEWLLTKPVSRAAYLLAKLVASLGGVLVTMIVVPCGIAYGLLAIANGAPLSLLSYLTCVLGLSLHTLFYLTLTLLLGVLVDTRGKLLGAALGVLFGGMVLPGLLGRLALAMPWVLPNLLPAFGAGATLPVSIWLPLGMTAAFTVVFVAAAIYQFQRLEF